MTADQKPDGNGLINFDSEYSSNYPSYLHKNQNGRLEFDPSRVIEGGEGEYDMVRDFGSSKDALRAAVPETEKIKRNDRPGITFLGFEDDEVRKNMTKITEIANDETKSPDNPEDRAEYRGYLKNVYKSLASEVKKRVGDEKALIFCPKNGGIFVRDVFSEEGFSDEDFFDYRMSRVIANDDEGKRHLNVATRFGENNPDIANYKTFVFADDCMASDISCTATLEYISSLLKEKNVDLSQIRVIISVSAATQRGLESILSEESKKRFGFGRIEAIAAIPVYEMTDEFYLKEQVQEEEQVLDGKKVKKIRFTVGDMGKWTKRPNLN